MENFTYGICSNIVKRMGAFFKLQLKGWAPLMEGGRLIEGALITSSYEQ